MNPAPDAAAPAAPSPETMVDAIAAAETTVVSPVEYAPRRWVLAVAALATAGLLCSVLGWNKLSGIQEQLARQSADAGDQKDGSDDEQDDVGEFHCGSPC